MKPVTQKQLNVLNWVKEYIKENQFPPTRAELSAGMGFKSPNAAQEHLKALSHKGYVKIISGTSRAIVLTGKKVRLAKNKVVKEERQPVKDLLLSPLNQTELYICYNGCGECVPVEFDYEYRTTFNRDTNETKRFTHKAFMSGCCGSEIIIFDEATGNERDAEIKQ
jgi:hypothetical protein